MTAVKAHFRHLLLCTVILACAFVGYVFAHSHYAKKLPVEGALPAAGFIHRSGVETDLSRFRGEVVLVNLWATYCPPCVAELPALDLLQAKLRDRGFRVVAISLDRTALEEVDAFWSARGLEQIDFYWDRDRQIPGRWKYDGIPTSYLLDREGRIVKTYNGAYKWDEEEIFRPIERLVNKKD